jgi:hypothetical protein
MADEYIQRAHAAAQDQQVPADPRQHWQLYLQAAQLERQARLLTDYVASLCSVESDVEQLVQQQQPERQQERVLPLRGQALWSRCMEVQQHVTELRLLVKGMLHPSDIQLIEDCSSEA